MEELIVFLTEYAVFHIAVMCFGIGYCIKHYIPKLPNNYIPLILACVGLLLNLAFNNFAFTYDIVFEGIGSGLIATGSFEAVRGIKNKTKVN